MNDSRLADLQESRRWYQCSRIIKLERPIRIGPGETHGEIADGVQHAGEAFEMSDHEYRKMASSNHGPNDEAPH
ncbi:hypothetical protein IV203_007624 [Nitzschia inconspicua]|uniref:Uncharacterized protein n=1 Tax=Nitzschia inconspicua TaxID=303405 RepID=A0A9K3KFV2_9STRA|nr:hypothetical protein IV203_007624 [Nitzschia inconspicua]